MHITIDQNVQIVFIINDDTIINYIINYLLLA